MSETYIVIGMMAELKNKMSKSQTSEFNDNEGDQLFINSEGTLVYMEEKCMPYYDFNVLVGLPSEPKDFHAICIRAGLDVKHETIRPFFTSWYNGSDSPQTRYTLEEFGQTLGIPRV